MAEQFCLRWNNHQSTLISVFENLLESGTLIDCMLYAEGQVLKAHKVVLSACSPCFEKMLCNADDKTPIIFLKDVKFLELKAMLDYMYRGEVNISQDQLDSFLKTAEALQIKGLADQGGGGGGPTGGGGGTSDLGEPPSKKGPGRNKTGVSDVAPESPLVGNAPLREGSVSPNGSKRRRRVARRPSADETSADNSCDIPPVAIAAQPQPQQITAPQAASTPIATDTARFVVKKQEPMDPPTTSQHNMIQPKTEFIEDTNEDIEDLTLDDDDDYSEMSKPGTSFSTALQGNTSQQDFSQWQMMGADRAQTDEVFMAAQEAINNQSNTQGFKKILLRKQPDNVTNAKKQSDNATTSKKQLDNQTTANKQPENVVTKSTPKITKPKSTHRFILPNPNPPSNEAGKSSVQRQQSIATNQSATVQELILPRNETSCITTGLNSTVINPALTSTPYNEGNMIASNNHIMVSTGAGLPEGHVLAFQGSLPVFIKGNDWIEQPIGEFAYRKVIPAQQQLPVQQISMSGQPMQHFPMGQIQMQQISSQQIPMHQMAVQQITTGGEQQIPMQKIQIQSQPTIGEQSQITVQQISGQQITQNQQVTTQKISVKQGQQSAITQQKSGQEITEKQTPTTEHISQVPASTSSNSQPSSSKAALKYSNFKKILPKPHGYEFIEHLRVKTISKKHLISKTPKPSPPKPSTSKPLPAKKKVTIVKNYIKILRPRKKSSTGETSSDSTYNVPGSSSEDEESVDQPTISFPETEPTTSGSHAFKKIVLTKKETDSVEDDNKEISQNDALITPSKLIQVLPSDDEDSVSSDQFILPDMPGSHNIHLDEKEFTNDEPVDDDENEKKYIIPEPTESKPNKKDVEIPGFKKIVLPRLNSNNADSSKDDNIQPSSSQADTSLPSTSQTSITMLQPSTSKSNDTRSEVSKIKNVEEDEEDEEYVDNTGINSKDICSTEAAEFSAVSGNFKYECNKCGRSYQVKQYYENHLVDECRRDPMFKCSRCSFKTHHPSNLRNHFHLKHVI